MNADEQKAMRDKDWKEKAEACIALEKGPHANVAAVNLSHMLLAVYRDLDVAERRAELAEGERNATVRLLEAPFGVSSAHKIAKLAWENATQGAHLAGMVRLLERLEKECEEHDREYHHLTDKALLQSVRGFLSSTPADSLARVQAMEEALRKIQRWAAPDAHRTMDEMMRDLGMIDDEARTALERK